MIRITVVLALTAIALLVAVPGWTQTLARNPASNSARPADSAYSIVADAGKTVLYVATPVNRLARPDHTEYSILCFGTAVETYVHGCSVRGIAYEKIIQLPRPSIDIDTANQYTGAYAMGVSFVGEHYALNAEEIASLDLQCEGPALTASLAAGESQRGAPGFKRNCYAEALNIDGFWVLDATIFRRLAEAGKTQSVPEIPTMYNGELMTPWPTFALHRKLDTPQHASASLGYAYVQSAGCPAPTPQLVSVTGKYGRGRRYTTPLAVALGENNCDVSQTSYYAWTENTDR